MRWSNKVVLSLALIVALLAANVDAEILTYKGSALWSGAVKTVVRDTLAYCGMVEGLMILNIADPTQPKLVSQLYLEDGFVKEIALKDSICLFAVDNYPHDGGICYLINVASPEQPTILSRYEPEYNCFGVAVFDSVAVLTVGSLGWVAPHGTGLEIVDISDPAAPERIGYSDSGMDPESSPFLQVLIRDRLAYAIGYGVLWIVDLSDPIAPQTVSLVPTYTYPKYYFPLSISFGPTDSLLYIANRSAVTPAGGSALTVMNIADLTQPKIITNIPMYGWVQEVSVVGNLAVVSNGKRGAQIFDLTDPAYPVQIGTYEGKWLGADEGPYFAFGVACIDTLCILTDIGPQNDDIELVAGASLLRSSPEAADQETPATQIHVISLADPTAPQKIGAYDLAAAVTGVVLGGRYAYGLHSLGPLYSSGLSIVDLLDPAHPVQVGYYATLGEPQQGVVRDSLLYLAGGSAGLEIVNVANPTAPVYLSNCPTGSGATDMKLRGKYAYVAGSSSGFYVIDVSDPASPVQVGWVNTPDLAIQLVLYDTLAFVADRNSGLLMINIADPSHPVLTDWRGTSHIYNSVAITGDFLWGGLISQMALYDLRTNPSDPTFHSWGPLAVGKRGIVSYGDCVFVSEAEAEISVMTVDNQDSARVIDSCSTPGIANRMDLDSLRAVAADRWGLSLYDVAIATDVGDDAHPILLDQITLLKNFPNPFNSSTQISFALSRASDVDLAVYNLLGQRVATLASGRFGAGEHCIRWEPANAASGIYLYRLKGGGSSLSRKMVLLK
ncbi:MAG: T9SS type A sorting domain-containing protein [candidate division Zixibacteria bacterium]|nr:T9SS type A sorting domain-containing protein [candidate division Zixibacteria bacterium]